MENPKGGAVLTLVAGPAAAAAISEWVAEHLGKTAVELIKPGAAEVVLEIYFDSTVEAEIAARALEPFQYRSRTVREYAAEEWTESWKKHFKPLDIGRRLRIVPPWEKGSGGSGERIEIVINPGLSFGTGNHFTTRFCLEELDRLIPESGAKTMLDIGTGSGILAITAAKLGVPRVAGVDVDPLCIEQAVQNAQANGVSARTEFFQHDIIAGWPPAEKVFCKTGRDRARPSIESSKTGVDAGGPCSVMAVSSVYDIVCANLYGLLLIENAATLLNITRRYLLLAGIRNVEADAVADTFAELDAREITRDADAEWCGLVFKIAD